jgi:TetR/AcrR family transcriptional regulator
MKRNGKPESLPMSARTGRVTLPPSGRAQTPIRVKRAELERRILHVAEDKFARHSFHGVSVDQIATAAGISKQNLLYYFPTKKLLYRRVLQDVLDEWLGSLATLAHANEDPKEAIRAYIAAKLKFSRDRPQASRLYASELLAGAPLYSKEIKARVVPFLQEAAEALERLSHAKRIESVNMTHLMFIIWAATQTYADFAHQIELALGKKKLEKRDFETAEQLIVQMVFRTLDLE